MSNLHLNPLGLSHNVYVKDNSQTLGYSNPLTGTQQGNKSYWDSIANKFIWKNILEFKFTPKKPTVPALPSPVNLTSCKDASTAEATPTKSIFVF